MAENPETQPKEFSIAYGRSGNKKDIYAGFYSRVRTVRTSTGEEYKNTDQPMQAEGLLTATDERRALFGAWSKKEKYIWAGREGRDDVFRRTSEEERNGFRTKSTDYHANGAAKEISRHYVDGVYRIEKYAASGDRLSVENGNVAGYRKYSRSVDGREARSEESGLFGLYSKKLSAVRLPTGKSVDWRIMQRRVGPYRTEVVPDKDGIGETRVRSFGKLFERTSHYNFETGEKTTSYKVPFFRERTNKPGEISAKEMKRYEERTLRREVAELRWDRAAVDPNRSDVRRSSADYKRIFEQKLGLNASRTGQDSDRDVAAWLHDVPSDDTNRAARRGRRFVPETRTAASFDDGYSTVVPNDSISVAGRPATGRQTSEEAVVQPRAPEKSSWNLDSMRAEGPLPRDAVKAQATYRGLLGSGEVQPASNPARYENSGRADPTRTGKTVASPPSFASPVVVEMGPPKLPSRQQPTAAPAVSVTNSSVASRGADRRTDNGSGAERLESISVVSDAETGRQSSEEAVVRSKAPGKSSWDLASMRAEGPLPSHAVKSQGSYLRLLGSNQMQPASGRAPAERDPRGPADLPRTNGTVASGPSFASPVVVQMAIPRLGSRPHLPVPAGRALSVTNSSVASRGLNLRDDRGLEPR